MGAQAAGVIGCITTVLATSLLAQPQAPPATFRSGIDVVRLDVTVLDKQRKPVRRLGQQDFTIVVDGVPQPIVAFDAVELPVAAAPTSAWMREVAPDVRTNALGEPRLFIIIMDDGTTNSDPLMVNTAKAVAHRIIDEMQPSDLASVVFTMDNSHAQELTAERSLLRAAVDHFSFGASGNPLFGRYVQRTIEKAAGFLGARTRGRSAIMLISSSPGNLSDRANEDASRARLLPADERDDYGAFARLAPVPIYGFNIAGLVAPNAINNVNPMFAGMTAERPYTEGMAKAANERFRELASLTGGRAIVDNNKPAEAVRDVFGEMNAYYTLAYRATYPLNDGRRRRLKVKVAREDVTVLPSDRILTTEKPRKEKNTPAPLLRAISDIVPASDLPMAVAVAPIAMPRNAKGRGPGAGILATVRLRRVAPPERSSDRIDVLATVFTPEGKQVATVHQSAVLTLRPADADAQLDVLTPIPLRPGRYNVRISARSVGLEKTGSVYTDVSVPDFDRDALTMAGLLVSAAPVPLAAPLDAFQPFVPVVPTTEREFTPRHKATVLTRIYQGKKTVPVNMTTRVIDATGKEVAASARQISSFSRERSADFSYDLPLTALAPGAYLLTIRAELDPKTSVARDLRFTVR